jgi:hypothetical protein
MRRRRAKNLEYESRYMAPIPVIEAGSLEPERRPLLAIEGPPRRERQRGREADPWTSVEEIYREKDVVYRGGRPPPPGPSWR